MFGEVLISVKSGKSLAKVETDPSAVGLGSIFRAPFLA